MDVHIYSKDFLQEFCTNVLKTKGLSTEHAELASRVLISADLKGIDSHGIARLSGYVRLIDAGRVNPKPNISILRSKKSAATVDGDSGLGLITAPYAMEIAIEKAAITGVGMIGVSNSNHFGISAYHALMATKNEMIGLAMTNASPLVSPTGTTERLLGTNPMCFTFPARQHQPIVVDLATSAAANGKLQIAERTGKTVPNGWIIDKNGKPSINPSELKEGGSLLPLGSFYETGSHKGYGLGAVVDLLSGVLTGANYGPWVPPFVSFLPLLPNLPGKGIGHFVGALEIDGFSEKDDYYRNIDQWISRFKAAKPNDPQKPVLIHGEPEYECEKERVTNGIPLVDTVVKDLLQLSKDLNINFK